MQDAEARLMWVSTFAVSALASNFERMGKPFNPLLGETYELKRPDFRIVCEQVSLTPRLCDSINNLYRVTQQGVSNLLLTSTCMLLFSICFIHKTQLLF